MEALQARRTAGQEGAARMKETARGLQGSGEQRRAPGSRPLSATVTATSGPPAPEAARRRLASAPLRPPCRNR